MKCNVCGCQNTSPICDECHTTRQTIKWSVRADLGEDYVYCVCTECKHDDFVVTSDEDPHYDGVFLSKEFRCSACGHTWMVPEHVVVGAYIAMIKAVAGNEGERTNSCN